MLARSALKELGKLALRMNGNRAFRLPERTKISEIKEEISHEKSVELPAAIALRDIADQLLKISSRADWDKLSLKTRREAPWALWTGDPEPIRIKGVLGSCRDDALDGTKIRRIQAMISSYVVHCNSDRPGILQFGEAIRAVLTKLDHEELLKWKERDKEFGFFDPHKGPRSIASSLIETAEPTTVLNKIGIHEPIFAGSDYVSSIHQHICELIASQSNAETDGLWLERLKYFLQDARGELRVPQGRTQLAISLLEPWSKGVTPRSDLRESLTNLLLRHLKDPRLYPHNWQGVPSNSKATFRRWLDQFTLEQFFDLISDRNDSEQWSYRRAFWSAVLKAGIIEESLVVLNPKAREDAGSRLGTDIKCGLLRGSGAADRSVILLRIGPLVFSEVSQNASLHAWRVSDPRAPKLDGLNYDWEQVYSAALNFPGSSKPGCLWHTSPDRGLWQSRAAALIQQYTRVSIQPRSWQPK